MLLIFSSSLTSRMQYIFNLLLGEILGLDFALTDNLDKYRDHPGPKMVYGKESSGEDLFLEAAGLLSETGIYPHEIETGMLDGLPVIFSVQEPSSILSFDPFSASFYMVSRYEEYNKHKKDKYGRFQITESIAWRGKFLTMPIVHLWAEKYLQKIQACFPELGSNPPDYRFVPTIDIDHFFAYRGREWQRILGSTIRSLLRRNFKDIRLRFRVLSGAEKDPYDVYDYFIALHHKMKLPALYFVLFANYGGHDNNISLKNKRFHHILRELDSFQGVGIHPSLSSNKHREKLEHEIRGLSCLLEREILVSRQHFLKISFPRTYHNLIRMGIRDDYSMGYASHLGFRAGIAIPFYFFDLSNNKTTSLRVHPVTLMDVTLNDYLRLSPEKSLNAIRQMVTMVKAVNGEFVSLWHNESLSELGRWRGWRMVYEEMLKMAEES